MPGLDIFDAGLVSAIIIAMLAGLLSFASPCVLPIVPPYLAYISGISLNEIDREKAARKRVFLMASSFVMGLSTIFILLGAASSALGRFFAEHKTAFEYVAGVTIIVFGLNFLGIIRLGFLSADMRFNPGKAQGNLFSAYIFGLAFAFGWSPCIGPQLGAILSLAAQEESILRGTLLLGVYALGLGVPFLLTALFLSRSMAVMSWMKVRMNHIEKIMGGFLILAGLLILTGQFAALSLWLLDNVPLLADFG